MLLVLYSNAVFLTRCLFRESTRRMIMFVIHMLQLLAFMSLCCSQCKVLDIISSPSLPALVTQFYHNVCCALTASSFYSVFFRDLLPFHLRSLYPFPLSLTLRFLHLCFISQSHRQVKHAWLGLLLERRSSEKHGS